MEHELVLNKTNRLRLARAFREIKRVDMSIECAIEGQMGRAFVDDLENPSAYRITVGPFWYFAGNPTSPGGRAMMEGFPAYNLLMPSAPGWVETAQEVFGENLQSFPRYSFSSAKLSMQHLDDIIRRSPQRERVARIDAGLAARISSQPDSFLDLSDFDSAEDFAERGIGYTLLDGDQALGAAYSSLVCSKGIEVSLFVEEAYRRQGVATALSASLLLECLQLGLHPNWDAANPESCSLALKLGYIFTETYEAYYRTEAR